MRAAPAAGLARARKHPRHVLLAALVAGLLAGPLWPGIAPAAAALALALMAARPRLALAAAAVVLLGATLADARIAALDRSALSHVIGSGVVARVILLEPPRVAVSGSRSALVELASGRGRGERVVLRLPRRVRWPATAVGSVLRADGRLAALRRFDGFQRRRGAHAVLLAQRLAVTGERRGGLRGALDRIRGRAERALGSGIGADQAALLRGMVLGQDEAVSDGTRAAFQRSSLAHLLAASGQNVLLLGALALPILTLLGLGLRTRLAAVIGLIALYVPLAGAGPSIQRAGVMGAAGLVAALAGRPASRIYALLLAAAVTLALNPRASGDAGWQLSFAAVLAILVAAPRLRVAMEKRGAPRALAEAAALTLAATLGTAPLIAAHFGRISLVALPANLLAAPAVAPVMWLGMLSSAAGQLAPGLAPLLNALAQFGVAYVEWVARAAAALPGASIAATPLSAAGMVLAAAGIALAVRSRAARIPVGLVLAAAALLAVLAARPPPPPDPRILRVSFLDIGQGDATLFQHGGQSVLFDTGPPGGSIVRRLRQAGVRRLDALVVTHAQADHEGMAAAIVRRMPVGLLIDGGMGAATPEHREIVRAASKRRVRRIALAAGRSLLAGPMRFEFIWPPAEPAALHVGQDPNLRAAVAVLRDGRFSALLPADAESVVTAGLALPDVDVLKVAHHGSEDTGLPDLLRRTSPWLAVIEVGRHNTYGHPTAQALRALGAAVPKLMRTDRDGTVSLTVTPDGRMQVSRR